MPGFIRTYGDRELFARYRLRFLLAPPLIFLTTLWFDLRDTHARLAGEAGVKIAVNTDAHQLSALEHIEMGVAQARRAWLTKDQVLNTRTWPQIKKLLK